jgi:predicted phage terminase large subunit-like protein
MPAPTNDVLQDKISNVIKRSRHSLPTFASLVLGEELGDFQKSAKMHYEFSEAFLNEGHNISLLWPRNSGKTTSCWIIAPCWNLVFGKYKYSLFVGESTKKAEGTFRGFRDIAINNPFIKRFIKRIISNRKDELVIEHINGNVMRFVCRGSGSSLRGLQERGERPDFIICDDLTSTKDIYSPEMMARQVDWFWSDVDNLGKNAHIMVVGTYLTEKCIAVVLNNNPPAGNTEKGIRPWKALRYSVINDEGESYWPERFPIEYLIERKETLRKANKLEHWYSELMNQGVGEGTRKFDLADIQHYSPKQFDTIKNELKTILIIDPAPAEGEFSVKLDRDHNTMITLAIDTGGTYWVVDCSRSRERLSTVADNVRALWLKHRPYRLCIEKLGGGVALLQTIEDKDKMDGIHTRPEYIDTKLTYSGKPNRIMALMPLFEKKRIMVPVSAPWVSELEEEMLNYPRGKHDDILDALAYAIQLIVKPNGARLDYNDLKGSGSSVF